MAAVVGCGLRSSGVAACGATSRTPGSGGFTVFGDARVPQVGIGERRHVHRDTGAALRWFRRPPVTPPRGETGFVPDVDQTRHYAAVISGFTPTPRQRLRGERRHLSPTSGSIPVATHTDTGIDPGIEEIRHRPGTVSGIDLSRTGGHQPPHTGVTGEGGAPHKVTPRLTSCDPHRPAM